MMQIWCKFKLSTFSSPSMLSIGQAARFLGVSRVSLRRWDRAGILKAYRTPGKHRRYSLEVLRHFYKKGAIHPESSPINRHILCYARVSGHKQKEKGDLNRQIEKLYQVAVQAGDSEPIMIKDVGSGLNSSRSGLKQVFRYVRNGIITKIIISYKDRLTRFGFNYIEEYCHLFGVPIIEVAQTHQKSVQQSLVDDMMTLIACFSGKLYGMRSKKARAYKSKIKSAKKYHDHLIQAEKWRILIPFLPNCYTNPKLRKLLI